MVWTGEQDNSNLHENGEKSRQEDCHKHGQKKPWMLWCYNTIKVRRIKSIFACVFCFSLLLAICSIKQIDSVVVVINFLVIVAAAAVVVKATRGDL